MKKAWSTSMMALLLTLGLISGCAETGEKAAESTSEKTTAPKQAQGEEEQKVYQQVREEIDRQTDESVPAGTQVAVLETAKGRIVFKFFPANAPNTVANFIKLAKEGFYDGTRFHRVVPGFVIQGGDPLSKDGDPSNDGTGDPGYKIKAEFNNLRHLNGTVAMARSADPDSAGSQFYICLGAQPSLDNQYTIFGQVIEGKTVPYSIAQGDLLTKVTIETR